MPAVRLICEGCRKPFMASRKDTKYCWRNNRRCRYKIRAEDAKFKTPRIPKSGVVGVTFNRIRQKWDVTIPDEKRRKYVGTRRTLQEAIQLQKEILGCN